jgi:hypothetical protein
MLVPIAVIAEATILGEFAYAIGRYGRCPPDGRSSLAVVDQIAVIVRRVGVLSCRHNLGTQTQGSDWRYLIMRLPLPGQERDRLAGHSCATPPSCLHVW